MLSDAQARTVGLALRRELKLLAEKDRKELLAEKDREEDGNDDR